ncbi:MAG: hypothetical protein WCO11_04445 [Sphingomonadales bacterium]
MIDVSEGGQSQLPVTGMSAGGMAASAISVSAISGGPALGGRGRGRGGQRGDRARSAALAASTAMPEAAGASADALQLAATVRRDLAALDFAALQALAGGVAADDAPGAVPDRGSGDGSADHAAAIARQVADMAQGLAALADKLAGQPQPAPLDVAEADCIAFIESQFRIRRLRGRHLPGLALGEPAWDILLDLAITHYWRRETSVTSLCIAADVPSTTALRWISSMTKAGLIVRRPCQRDGRRSFLAIAPETYQAMLALAADALRTDARVRQRYQRNGGN